MAAFISGGAEPEPEPQPDPSESKLPLMALSADGTVYQHGALASHLSHLPPLSPHVSSHFSHSFCAQS